MKLGIIISSNDPETCWNAIRFANFCLKQNDSVSIFLIGKGVEYEGISTPKFDTIDQMQQFYQNNGKLFACGTCIKSREQKESSLCPLSTLKDLYDLVRESDKVISF